MKVLFFQPYLANWRIQFLERFISETEHDVCVYDGGYKNSSKFVTGHKTKFSYTKLFDFSLSISLRNQDYQIFFSPALFFHLLRDRPDVIITEGEINFINNLSIYIYTRIFNKKYIWWSLGKVRTRKKTIINKIFDPLVNFLIKSAACIMARNTLAKKYYLKFDFIDEDKVVVAPNSMDEDRVLEEFNEKLQEELFLKKGNKIGLYVGALVPSKAPMNILYSYKNLKDKESNYPLDIWFVGDGNLRSEMEEYVIKNNLTKNVKFFGKIFEGVSNYFSVCDFVIVPGLGGLVINHAMILGKPVISVPADGTELDLVINGKTGILVDDTKVESLINAIDSLTYHNSLHILSRNCKDLIESKWNMNIMIKRVEDCINISTNN